MRRAVGESKGGILRLKLKSREKLRERTSE